MKSNKNLPISHKSISISQEKLGVPGIRYDLVLAPSDSKQMKLTNQKQGSFEIKDISEREFEVISTLGKQFNLSGDISFFADKGNSFLLIPPNVEGVDFTAGKLQLKFEKNSNNQISLITSKLKATSFNDACNKFLAEVYPFLDYLSYSADRPIVIDNILCKDFKNGLKWIRYITPYTGVALDPCTGEIYRGLHPIFALYREAKNASSDYYKFLCYYKILEGIYKNLRASLNKEAEDLGKTINRKRERVPQHPELQKFYPEYIGQSIPELFNNKFQKEYRHAVAHFRLDNGSCLNLSDHNTVARYSNIILLIELCCRVVIGNHIDYLQQLHA